MGVLKILQKCLDTVAKVLSWLLVKLGLWLSVLYVIAFFVICAVTNTAFSSVQNLFWACLLVAVILGIWISLALASKSRKIDQPERVVGNIPKVKKKNGKEDYEELRENYSSEISSQSASMPSATYIQPAQPVIINSQPPVTYYAQPVISPQPYVQPYYAAPQYINPQQVQPMAPMQQPQQMPQYNQPQYQQPSNNGSSIFTSYHQPQVQPDNRQQLSARDILFSQDPQPVQKPEDDGKFLRYPRPAEMVNSSESPSTPPATPTESVQPQTGFYTPQGNYDYSAPNYSAPNRNPDYNAAAPRTDMPDYYNRASAGNRNPYAEKPKIYRTRTDPDVLIYEYSTHLDYYKKTPEGLRFIKSVYKNEM